jgi:hypothetical protein
LVGLLDAAAAVLPLVTGSIWNASSLTEKRAYLIGIANTVALHCAVIAKHSGADPHPCRGAWAMA